MVSQFIFIKKEGEIINVADIIRVSFTPAELDGDETTEYATLEIFMSSNDRSFTIEDDEDLQTAEATYLALIKALPNLITI